MPDNYGELFPYIVLESISLTVSFKIITKTSKLEMDNYFPKT